MFPKRLKVILLYLVLPPALVAAYAYEQGGSVAAEIFLGIWGVFLLWIFISAPVSRPMRSDVHRVSDQLEEITDLLKKANERR